MKSIIKYIFQKKTALLLLCLSLVILPACIIYVGINSYFEIEEELLFNDLNSKFRTLTGDLQRFEDVEAFIVNSFDNGSLISNVVSKSVYEYVAFCREMVKYWGDNVKAVVFDDKYKPLFKSKNLDIGNDVLEKVLYSINTKSGYWDSFDYIKEVLGNQLTKDNFDFRYYYSSYKFINADNSGKKWPFFVCYYGNLKICIWATKDFLGSNKHIEFISRKFANINKLNIGAYSADDVKNTIHLCNANQLVPEVRDIICSQNKEYFNASTNNYWICDQYISNGTNIFIYTEKKFPTHQRIVVSIALIIFYLLVFSSVFKYCFKKILFGVSNKISIKTKLAVVVIFSSCISLLLFFIVCKEYEVHKKYCLMADAKEYSKSKLLEIDRRYEAFLNNINNDFNAYLDSWAKTLKNRELNVNDVNNLNSKLIPYDIGNYYCVASQSNIWIEKSGCFKYSGDLDKINLIPEESKILDKDYDFKQFKFINLVAKRVCADINEVELPKNVMSKLDLIAETLTKHGFVEIVYSVIKNLNHISPWGYAEKNCTAFFKLISVNDEIKSDYLFSCLWHNSILDKYFIEQFIPIANSNESGFKFLYFHLYCNILKSREMRNEQLFQFTMKTAGDNSGDEPEILNINNKQYLVTGYKSPVVSNMVFIGLYPLSEIDAKINDTVSLLWILLGFTAILIIFSMCLLIGFFIEPLKALENKAIALENGNYEYLPSNAMNDEFGQLNNTFNEAMDSMKELELARLVQEGMFPKSKFEQCEFNVYGKSHVMTVVGGDYFDIFPVKDNSFVVLLGDVAGHGVGASVLMAMAKSAIIAGKDKYQSPSTMLNYLHKMVLATKTSKQRKIMTFQYLFMNSVDGDSLYGNAGGCAPCIVRNMGTVVEELKMPGPVLGAFKKANYKEMPLNLKNGDAMIFYTDGIVEAKNAAGEMLGYEALFEIFKQAYHANPEQYYKNIYSKYLEHIKGLEPQDDMTIVIVVRQSQKTKLWEEVDLLDLA